MTMSKMVEISDEAWEILQHHMKIDGSRNIVGEMDELFSCAEEVWYIHSDDVRKLVKQLKKKFLCEWSK